MSQEEYLHFYHRINTLTQNDPTWHSYVNGNYTVWINDESGTKIRLTDDDSYCAERPESIDLKITE